MFHHSADRLRLFRLLVAGARKQRGITQGQLAEQAAVSQSVISQLEVRDYRRVSRQSVVKVLARGLDMEPSPASALLWLYDGEPLRESELAPYSHNDTGSQGPLWTAPDEQELSRTVLALLERWVESGEQRYQADVGLIFQNNDAARLAAMHEILRLEGGSGQRLLITKYPSSLANTPETLESQALRTTTFSSDEARRAAAKVLRERREAFVRNLGTYGERSIHSKVALMRYVTAETGSRTSLQARRRHIEHWIDLLEEHAHYQVGMVSTTPQLEVGIKSTTAALVRGAPRDDDTTKACPWGLSHVFWYGERSVVRLLVDFERHWERIEPESRDKQRVTAWLRQQLEAR